MYAVENYGKYQIWRKSTSEFIKSSSDLEKVNKDMDSGEIWTRNSFWARRYPNFKKLFFICQKKIILTYGMV